MRQFVLLACLLCPTFAAAQGSGGVANSGMGQGEARISSRSNVRLSMESMPGTSGSRVSALGTRVGARMTRIRTCYTDIVAEHPTVTGTLRLRVLLVGAGTPTIEVDSDDTDSRDLRRCISRALQSIDHSDLRRPTRAVVQLVMGNSAARGAERAAARAGQAGQVSLEVDSDGNVTSTGGTPNGHVRFVATGQGRESAEAVAAAHRALLSALPGLLDCRRRAGRRGHSSEGEIRAVLNMRGGRAPASRVTQCTVTTPRARGCVSRALRGIELRGGGSGRVSVRISFAAAEVVEGARD